MMTSRIRNSAVARPFAVVLEGTRFLKALGSSAKTQTDSRCEFLSLLGLKGRGAMLRKCAMLQIGMFFLVGWLSSLLGARGRSVRVRTTRKPPSVLGEGTDTVYLTTADRDNRQLSDEAIGRFRFDNNDAPFVDIIDVDLHGRPNGIIRPLSHLRP